MTYGRSLRRHLAHVDLLAAFTECAPLRKNFSPVEHKVSVLRTHKTVRESPVFAQKTRRQSLNSVVAVLAQDRAGWCKLVNEPPFKPGKPHVR